MKKIGITTTVPAEVLIAAGFLPVDLNNILVADRNPERLVNIAERAGFPLNCCTWIKGIYGVCLEYGIDDILCVTGGDCSNTAMLMEVLKTKGLNAIPFAYPESPDANAMQKSLESLAGTLGTTVPAAEEIRQELQPVRELAREIDDLTWRENRVSGWENHLHLISTSDFNQDFRKYREELQDFLEACRGRQPFPSDNLRLAYIGVPSVYARDLYTHVERHGARVVFNEIQRQFSMPEGGETLAEQYTRYTYPYSIKQRLDDIMTEIKKRGIDGVVHYVQAFCHRGIGDIVFRRSINLPVLTIEGNDDFHLNNHVKTRVEAFLDMIIRSRRETRATGDRSKKIKITSGGEK